MAFKRDLKNKIFNIQFNLKLPSDELWGGETLKAAMKSPLVCERAILMAHPCPCSPRWGAAVDRAKPLRPYGMMPLHASDMPAMPRT